MVPPVPMPCCAACSFMMAETIAVDIFSRVCNALAGATATCGCDMIHLIE